jgi:DNA-binding NtrC family response regulator
MPNRQAVLVVEDDSRWQSILKELIRDEGYEVTVIADYQDCRQALQEHIFDLVIIDLQLDESAPILDGERLLDHISRRYPATPCIVVSGQGDIRIVRDAFKQYHVVDYIAKDRFDIATFVTAVKTVLGQDQTDEVREDPTTTSTLAGARRALEEGFGLEEIRDLCFDLAIDFDNLPGEGKKAREVVAYCQRCGRLEELVANVTRLRPGLL